MNSSTLVFVIAGLILFVYLALKLSKKKGPVTPTTRRKSLGGDEVIKHFYFQADMNISTPLSTLEHHGEIRYPGDDLPKYGNLLRGIWIPVTKSWEELLGPKAARKAKKLLPGSDESAIGKSMQSDIGAIPSDGGKYLPFLREFRKIVESKGSPEAKRSAIESLAERDPEYRKFINRHERIDKEWMDQWLGYNDFLGIADIATNISKSLYESGFRSSEDLMHAEDKQLLSVKGVGPATVKKIRQKLFAE
jgi:hypothetical protein